MDTKFIQRIKPVLFFSNIFGLAFFSLGKSTWQTVKFCPFLVYYSYSVYQSLREFDDVKYYNNVILMRTSDMMQLIVSAVYMGIRTTRCMQTRGITKELIMDVAKLDETFNEKQYTNLLKRALLPLGGVVTVFTLDLFINILPPDNTNFTLFYYNSYSLIIFVGVLESFYIYVVLNGLARQVEEINGKLQEKLKAPSEDLVQDVAELMSRNRTVTNMARKANNIFNIQILTGLGVNFIYATVYVHFLVSTAIKSSLENLILVTAASWNALLMLWAIFIIYPWISLKIEADKTASYIHDIWNKYVGDQGIADMAHLQLVSLELLNNPLEFSACDFFTIDWTVIQTMIAAITTYVIILIQIENM